jgi:RimJ/RimL family protein N-acetyltransferase
MIPELRSERLRLRGWLDRDRAPYAALNADPEVMRHFPATLTPRQSDEMVDRMQAGLTERGFGLWAVERLDTSEFIGFVGVAVPTWHADEITPCVEIGWRLARQHWGNGFAPEAAREVLAFSFERVELPRDEIVSFTTELNLKSQRVMQKIGLRRDIARDFDHPMTPGWAGARHVVYAIDRPAWEAGVAR